VTNLGFPIKSELECGHNLLDENVYKISVAFSDCTEQGCSVRTYVKRIREWGATGWKTDKSVVDFRGFIFEVKDGLLEELIVSADGKLSEIVK